jgi:two-component system sensor kinase FixL
VIYLGLLVLIALGAKYIVSAGAGRASAKEALKDHEDKFRAMRSGSFNATIVSNIEGIITEANPIAENLFGYADAELNGKELAVIIPERYREKHRESFNKFITTGEGKMLGAIIEVSGLKKSGEEFEVDMIVNSFMVAGEMYFIATFHERT